jgi:hypothetical protein
MSFLTRGGKYNPAGAVPGVTQRQRVTLTSAQILALFTTPITLIAAPGAGMYVSVDEIVGILKFGTIAYTGANAGIVSYTSGAGAAATSAPAAAWINSASTTAVKLVGVAVTPVANAPVVLSVGTANPGAGDGTMTLDVSYRVVSLS